MGYERHSHAVQLGNMDPIKGGHNEFLFLFAILGLGTFVAAGRKSNEDGLRSQLIANNSYARLGVVAPAKWEDC